MTMFTSEFIAGIREQIKSISPLPWRACSCGKCGQISNETDCVAIATRGNWGDNYPDIRRISGSIEGKFEVFVNQITYGHIPPETGNANANYIAEACTNYPEALNEIELLQFERQTWIDKAEILETQAIKQREEIEKLKQRVQELEQEQRWIPVAEWEQKEDVDMLLRVVVRDLRRTFTGYLENGEFKIPLDWANSIPIILNLVTHVMELPKPPREEE